MCMIKSKSVGCCYLRDGFHYGQDRARSHPTEAFNNDILSVWCNYFLLRSSSAIPPYCIFWYLILYLLYTFLLYPTGTYSSPVSQRWCSRTAKRLATPTTACFLAAGPPLWALFCPQLLKSLSGAKGPIIYWAALTSKDLRYSFPAFVIRHCLDLSPDWSALGQSPK